MAGKFLSVDEAADHLGVTAEKVRQLVDRRQISALRDTAGPKFRVEDLDRYLAEAADEAAASPAAPPAAEASSAVAASDDGDTAKEADSGLSLDGLELDLGDSNNAEVVIHEPQPESAAADAVSPEPSAEAKPASTPSTDDLVLESGLDLGDLELASGPSLVGDSPAAAPPGDEASLVLGDDLEESPADGPQTIVGGDDSLVIADDGPNAGTEDPVGDASLVAGDDIVLSGLDISLDGNSSGPDIAENSAAAASSAASPATPDGSGGDGAEPQSVEIGGSFADDLDLESLVAGSEVVGDGPGSPLASAADLLSGSDLLGGSVVGEPAAAGSGILSDSGSGAGDVGSQISGGSGVIMEGGIDLQGDEVKPWDVDLGEFMNDVEEDADAPTMLGGGGEFDLDDSATADDPSQSAELASESQIGGDSSFFDKSQGPGDSSFFDQSVGLDGGLTAASPLSEMPSSSQMGIGIETKFTALQVTGLICCSLLLLIGGLLTFDLVRTIGSPNDTPLASPIAGGLASLMGFR